MSTAARRSLVSSAFHGAYETLTSTVAERRSRRLTPPAPPPPRDSDPQAGEALPSHHAAPPSSDDGRGRDAALAPTSAAWAWSEGDSDDGGTRR